MSKSTPMPNPIAALTIVMAQINPLVGDIHGNTQLVIHNSKIAISQFAPDIVVFPEMVLTAYPPEDLLLRPSLDIRIAQALQALCAEKFPVCLVIGYPGRIDGHLYNMLAIIKDGVVIGTYCKQCLPNYQVFDEKRYFKKGHKPLVINIAGIPVAFTICEDLWKSKPMRQARDAGAKLMININGSPFHLDKTRERKSILQQRAIQGEMPIVYVNQVGGQDELVFDGGSMAVDAYGAVQVQLAHFKEQLVPVRLDMGNPLTLRPGEQSVVLSSEAQLYAALVLGLRDYVRKNHFHKVILGLSGGIDSALTLALAVDALGKDCVHAIMMPFAYTAQMSIDDATTQAQQLGVDFRIIPIGDLYAGFMTVLADEFAGTAVDLAEQNLQARCRGVLLMAISNKKGMLVLTTGNKSEMAVGYSTLYGDMAGGFDVLKDVPKMYVYALARYRNGLGVQPVIPQRVIERPPTAELAPGQLDADSLPPYPVLDRILELYIEEDLSAQAICAQGFDLATVEKVICLVDRNEYKRRQAPIGVRISKRGFGRDRRYPITAGWKPGD